MPLSNPAPRRRSVPLLLALALGLVLAACGGYDSAPDEATGAAAAAEGAQGGLDEMGLIAAHKSLIRAMEEGNITDLTALMDPTSDLIVFHPFVENRFDGITEVDEGLGRMFEQLGGVSWTVRTGGLEDSVAAKSTPSVPVSTRTMP